MIYCGFCGTANRDGSRYCNSCGSPLGGASSEGPIPSWLRGADALPHWLAPLDDAAPSRQVREVRPGGDLQPEADDLSFGDLPEDEEASVEGHLLLVDDVEPEEERAEPDGSGR